MSADNRAPVIDFHIHFTPPRLQPDDVRAGRVDRRVEYVDDVPVYIHHPGANDLAHHVEMMDHAGVDISIISSGPGMEGSLETCRIVNDVLAEGSERFPGRIEGLAHAPVIEGDAALDEVRRAVKEHGFRGAVITSTIDGRSLDDPGLEEFWSLAEELDIFVLVHPGLKSTSLGLRNFDRYDLFRTVGREFDLQLATLSLILGGVLDRHPSLRLVISHLAGGLASVWGRVRRYQDKRFWGVDDHPRHGQTAEGDPDSYLSRLFFDTGGFFGDLRAVEAALTQIPASQIVFGTDYPQELRTKESVAEFVEGLRGMGPEGAAILNGNAGRLLGRDAASA
jgi:aminocarboxymuconate-semialdehyde decarboxylase